MIANALARRNGGGAAVIVTLPVTAGGSDAFIVKYNTSGLAQWATTVPGTTSDIGYAIATDSTGVYVTGYYNASSVITLNNDKTLPITIGFTDAFIVKYNTSGLAQWSTTIRTFPSAPGYGITTDSTGVYVTGLYNSSGVVTLNNGITLPATAGGGTNDAFIVKYNTSGLAQWSTTIRGITDDRGFAIRTDSTGVYVTGQYTSSEVVTLNNGITLPVSAGGTDAFIVKYNTSGLAQWATTVAGTGNDRGLGIATDSTGVYVSGSYISSGVVTLNNGITLPPSNAGLIDAFIVKYNTSGLAQWSATIQGTLTDDGFAIATDSTDVYVTGQYRSSGVVTLNNGITLPVSLNNDAFIVKYNTSGLAQWATTIRGGSADQGLGIATDSTGIYLTGYYSANSFTATLNNGITLPLSEAGGNDAFIVKYNTSGLAQWATTIRGTLDDIGYGIATDSTGVYVTGEYRSSGIVTL